MHLTQPPPNGTKVAVSDGGAGTTLSSSSPRGKKQMTTRNRDSDGSDKYNDKDGRDIDEVEDYLWCQYCIDDPSITICCFCGCRVS